MSRVILTRLDHPDPIEEDVYGSANSFNRVNEVIEIINTLEDNRQYSSVQTQDLIVLISETHRQLHNLLSKYIPIVPLGNRIEEWYEGRISQEMAQQLLSKIRIIDFHEDSAFFSFAAVVVFVMVLRKYMLDAKDVIVNRITKTIDDVVKELKKQGIMAAVTQSIDADTAELVTL